MTDRGSSWPHRLAFPAGRFLLSAVIVIVTLPFAVFWIIAVCVLLAFRPLIVVLLGLATVGGAAVGGWFAFTGHWPDAFQAGIVAAVSGALLVGYVALADRAGFDGSAGPSILPPWWWYF